MMKWLHEENPLKMLELHQRESMKNDATLPRVYKVNKHSSEYFMFSLLVTDLC